MEKLYVIENTLSLHGGRVRIGTRTNGWLAETKGCHVNGTTNEDAEILARRLVASYNACEGIETEMLGNISVSGVMNSMYSAEKRAGVYQKEIERLKAQNAQLLDALQEIAEGKGRYSLNPAEHAINTIEDMKKLAVDAIAAATEKTETP